MVDNLMNTGEINQTFSDEIICSSVDENQRSIEYDPKSGAGSADKNDVRHSDANNLRIQVDLEIRFQPEIIDLFSSNLNQNKHDDITAKPVR